MKQPPYVAECPNCEARLPIEEEQMQQAQGNVRCANCREVFYAPDQLLKGFYNKPAANRTSDDILFLPDDPPQSPVATDLDSPRWQQRERASSDNQHQPSYRSDQNDDDWRDQPTEDADTQSDDFEDVEALHADSFRYEADPSASVPNNRSTAKGEKRGKRANKRHRSVPHTLTEEPGQSSPSNLLWWAGSFVLVSTIALTIFAAGFEKWSAKPIMRGVYMELCTLLDCELPRNTTPVLMEISAAGQKQLAPGKYRVKGVILNKAYYSQPLPVIKLEFIDLQDNVQATRVFKPAEYSTNLDPLLPANNQPFTLDVELLVLVQFRLIPRFSLVSY